MKNLKNILGVFLLNVMVTLLTLGMSVGSKAQASDVMTYIRFENPNITTMDVYCVNGKWDPERVKTVHEPIIQHYLQLADGVPAEKRPICFMYGGGSGAGKSTVVRKLVAPIIQELGLEMPVVAPDTIKEMMPEYEMLSKQNSETWGFRMHMESSYIKDEILSALIEQEKCFQYDGAMSNFGKYSKLIGKLKKHDYEVHAVGVDVPVAVALERAKARARAMDPAIIEKYHKGFAENFLKICNLDGVTDYSLYSNIGQEPELILDNKGVYNETLYKEFLKKGGKL